MEVRTKPPVDRGCFVGIVFFILGLGTLLPWNFFMTASLYFQARLNESEWTNGTLVVRKNYYFNNWMTLLSQLPLLLFTLLNSILYQRVSEAIRIAGSLIFMLLLFILTAALVKVHMDADRFFSITMATIWFINSFGAVLQGSLFGLVGLLPQKYSAIFMSGQGLAGTFAASAMLVAIGSDADSTTAALGYFITPCVGTLVTLVSYLLLPHLSFARFYLSKSSKYEGGAADQLLNEGGGTGAAGGGVQNVQLNGHASGHASEKEPDGTKEAFLPVVPGGRGQSKASVIQVFKKIWVMAFCVTFVFTVTLSVFPAVTADVKTAFPKWERFFIAVCCFLTFNLGDWFGRTVTTFIHWPCKDSRLFPLLVVSRMLLVPLLMLCNVQGRAHLPVYFGHDAAFTTIMVVFSVSSGYFVCLSMSYAPQLVEAQDGETAGALMTFFLALGLSLGAALSFPLRALI